MHFRGEPDKEPPTKTLSGKRRRWGFSVVPHIHDSVVYDLPDPLERSLGALGKPAETGEFDAKTDVFLIII
jgi:hypothetical protein